MYITHVIIKAVMHTHIFRLLAAKFAFIYLTFCLLLILNLL